MKIVRHPLSVLAALAAAAVPSAAFDGGSAPPEAPPSARSAAPTYYEEVLASQRDAGRAPAAGGLPARLHVVGAAGAVVYRPRKGGRWEVTVEVAERPHERVDAVYDLVLALALPADHRSDQWRLRVREGSRRASAPAVYAGERVSLKRNRALEASWLPLLVGAREGLPDLAGTAYVWTLWDAIVRYDAGAGPTLEGFARFGYRADARTPAPNPGAAYLISWMPSLGAAVAPYTLRLDAVAPGTEGEER